MGDLVQSTAKNSFQFKLFFAEKYGSFYVVFFGGEGGERSLPCFVAMKNYYEKENSIFWDTEVISSIPKLWTFFKSSNFHCAWFVCATSASPDSPFR